MRKSIPLIDFPGFGVEDGFVYGPQGNPLEVEDQLPLKTPRVVLCYKGNKSKFKLWFLQFIAETQDTEWDWHGYQLFRRCWQPIGGIKTPEGEQVIITSPATLEARTNITMLDILVDDLEYKWWSDYTSGMELEKCKRFNDKLLEKILADKYHLSTNVKIKKFYGGMFRRGVIEVERAILFPQVPNRKNTKENG
jgi:hypothetical protein